MRIKMSTIIFSFVTVLMFMARAATPVMAQVEYWALFINGDDAFVEDTDYMCHIIKDHYAFNGVQYLSPAFPHPGVNSEATKAEARSAITDWLANHSDDDDVIFIYFSGHGGGYDADGRAIEGGRIDTSGDEGNEVRESTILEVNGVSHPGGFDANGDGDIDDWVGVDECLWIGNEQYWDDEIASDLSTLTCATLVLTVDAGTDDYSGCFSGGIIDDASGPNRIIMTATHETTFAYGDMDGDRYSEWSEVFIDALHGENTHWDNGIINEDPVQSVDADANDDGHVSLREAWDYAWDHDDARLAGLSTPWLDDDGNGLPTYLNEADQLDPDDGDLANTIWLRERGGTQERIRSAADGLSFLRWYQNDDGSWQSNVGTTSMSALAFLNAGNTEDDPTVSMALDYIVTNVQGDGSISNSGYPTYETSLAVLALVAADRANDPDKYATQISNAKDWLVGSQWDDSCWWGSINESDWRYGGFGYGHSERPDLSNTQFALMALSASELPSGSNTWAKAITFVSRCQNRPASNDQGWAHDDSQPSYNDGGFIYLPGTSLAGGTKSYGSMTAAGIWSLRLSGVDEEDGQVQAGLGWLVNNENGSFDDNPGMPDGRRFQYYYYYSIAKALAMSFLNDLGGVDWYAALSNKLAELQYDDGHWQNSYTGHGSEHISEIATDFALLTLQTRQPPLANLSMSIILASPANLVIYDPQDRMCSKDECNIPGATFEIDDGEQIVELTELEPGHYRFMFYGTGDGTVHLTVNGHRDDEIISTECKEFEITNGEVLESDVLVSSLVGALTITVEDPEPPAFVPVEIDIMPETCPNYLSVESKGVMPVAILGGLVDVTQIDPDTLYLEGVYRKRWNLEDVTRPHECEYDYENPDGHLDMTLKYSRTDIVNALGQVSDGDVLNLTLTGNLKPVHGGTPIMGSDTAVIVKK